MHACWDMRNKMAYDCPMKEQHLVYKAEESQFIENVQRLREAKGWSQGELARQMANDGWDGFHQTTISRIEKGQRPIRLAEARALARILGSQVGLMIAPAREADALEELALNIGHMRIARRRIWNEVETLEQYRFSLGLLIEAVEKISQDDWERLGLWEFVAQMVVQASHMQKWSPLEIIGEAMGIPDGKHPEEA